MSDTIKPPEPFSPFEAANRMAPIPGTREAATTEAWVRHYAALALAAHVEFRRAIRGISRNAERGSRPDIGFLVGIGATATALVQALTTTNPTDLGGELWDLTPEYGALNGEWEDYLDGVLVGLGINPAEIDPDLDSADFEGQPVT